MVWSFGRGIAGIEEQVDKYLQQLVADHAYTGGKDKGKSRDKMQMIEDPLAGEQFQGIFQDRYGIEDFGLQLSGGRIIEQFLNQPVDTPRLLGGPAGNLLLSALSFGSEQFQVTDDRPEGVADFVGHARRQMANGSHFFRTGQFGPGVLQLVIGLLQRTDMRFAYCIGFRLKLSP
jgi:hypothetical protein